MRPTIWIDVEDLFEYARTNIRPSGIQRLAFEIYHVLARYDRADRHIRFVRHSAVRTGFRVVCWQEIAALFASLTDSSAPVHARPAGIPSHGAGRRGLRKLVQRLPSAIRGDVIAVLLTSTDAFRAWVRLFAGLAKAALRAPGQCARRFRARNDLARVLPAHATEGGAAIDFAAAVAPGDVMLVLGSPWFHPDYEHLVRTHRDKYGLRFAMLVYDLIPLRRPEWCDANLVRLFRGWVDPMLSLCDQVFAISKATAADVEAYVAENGITLAAPVLPLPIGTGFNGNAPAADAAPMPGRDLPPPGSYALIVATIEARKNHLLLFRVWRRLLDDLPADQVPTLVFAGRVGWLVDDLMRQISNTNNLGGKLILVENPTDAELVHLYSGCLFSLCPSFYEGWGLPVTESLALGKPCLISNRTSLPEAGGTLARSFDPDNLQDAYAAIRAVIEDRAGLAVWEARVRREFKPVPWSATAEALLAGLDARIAD